MEKREEKRSELDIIKILNARATVTVHIYMVIVALVLFLFCKTLHMLMLILRELFPLSCKPSSLKREAASKGK